MKLTVMIIRWILTLGMIFMAYRETGPWTVACLLLIAFAIEAESMTRNKINDLIIEAMRCLKRS